MRWVVTRRSVGNPPLRRRGTASVPVLTVSPLLDFGEEPVEKYAEVLIGAVSGVIHLSNGIFKAPNLRFHLRSPEDINFFRALGTALEGGSIIDSVEIRGAWLYMRKAKRTAE